MIRKFFESIGKHSDDQLKNSHDTLAFLGETVASLALLLKNPRKLRWSNFAYYLDNCGVLALPIVLLICFLMGVTIAFQSAIQMVKFGTEIYVADLVGFSMLKEFGPLMVAIIATGRAGSSFAAEIGSMKAEEEISALTTMGISPVRFLVVPKLLAMIIAMPVLTVFGDIAGLAGGLAVGMGFLGLTAETYLSRTAEVLTPMVFILGVFKGVFFGAMIALVGCREGFCSQADSQGVGRAATSAVVKSILCLIILDTILTVIYSFWGY
ncbi:MAG: ABC transporter permease [Lentisphaerae bacterium]|nr:ABC transporter permease [Lentisphaerota bacterium]